MTPSEINLELAGNRRKVFTDLALDYSGTLSLHGELLPGVAKRLKQIAGSVRITVLTADTFGKAASQLAGLPLETRIVKTGAEKAKFVKALGAERVIAVGNGRNDVAMVKTAGLGIAVIGPEGAAAELLRVADVVTRDIRDALDLIANPLRLKATLRD